MLSAKNRSLIQDAFAKGSLKIRAISPAGDIGWQTVLDVHRAEVPWETIYAMETSRGSSTLTAGHRVYVKPNQAVEVQYLVDGDMVMARDNLHSPDGVMVSEKVLSIRPAERRQFMYDLTVDAWHTLVLENSGLAVHNCPDRNYHFRPPEHEGSIGQYNQVFGQIWEDAEFLEYLERALDWWNMFPPETEDVSSIDLLVSYKPVWRTVVLWGAIAHACFALATNWVAEEFSLVGSTEVLVILPSGKAVTIRIDRLYALCHLSESDTLTSDETAIMEAYHRGLLRVPSATREGRTVEATLAEVLRHHTPGKRLLKVATGRVDVTCTEDHSLFSVGVHGHIFPFSANEIKTGWSTIAIRLPGMIHSDGTDAGWSQVVGSGRVYVTEAPSEEYTYDLSVPGPENFFLANGILAHNSYSIGGVSLDIERSSKYESLKQNAEGNFKEATETKMQTVKFIRGLRQPKYGLGIRSAFGGNVGRGVLSPRNFL
jgi:hypothetical protein